MGNEKVPGSMEVLNSMQITAGAEGMERASKEPYKNKEVLAVILKGAAREFESYSYKEIMGFIEAMRSCPCLTPNSGGPTRNFPMGKLP